MEHFFTTTIGIVVSLGAILTVAVVGLLYVIGLFKKGKNGEDDRLIDILQKTVTELEKKVDKQTEDISQLSKQVTQLTTERNTYLEVLQGKDEATKEFYKQALKSMEIVNQTHDSVTTMAESIKNTNANMSQLIELLGKHLEAMNKVK